MYIKQKIIYILDYVIIGTLRSLFFVNQRASRLHYWLGLLVIYILARITFMDPVIHFYLETRTYLVHMILILGLLLTFFNLIFNRVRDAGHRMIWPVLACVSISCIFALHYFYLNTYRFDNYRPILGVVMMVFFAYVFLYLGTVRTQQELIVDKKGE